MISALHSCPFDDKLFSSLHFRPLLVDLTVEENQRLKVIYGSEAGFHAIDLDTNTVFDLYLCPKVCVPIFLSTYRRSCGIRLFPVSIG